MGVDSPLEVQCSEGLLPHPEEREWLWERDAILMGWSIVLLEDAVGVKLTPRSEAVRGACWVENYLLRSGK